MIEHMDPMTLVEQLQRETGLSEHAVRLVLWRLEVGTEWRILKTGAEFVRRDGSTTVEIVEEWTP